MSILKQIFGENAYWQVNKDIAREVGVEAALILADIVSKWMFHKKNNPEKNGWFYNSVKQMTEDTTIKEHRQREAINILVAKGFIEVKIKGVPATRNFNVNEQAIIQYFEGLGTSCEKTEELVTPKSQNYNNNNNNNKNNYYKKSVADENTIQTHSLNTKENIIIDPDKSRLNYFDIANIVKEDAGWIDILCMNLSKSKDYILLQLEKFPLEQKANGKEIDTINGFKRHFNNYIKKVIQNPQKTVQAKPSNDYGDKVEKEYKEFQEKLKNGKL